jgi:hypothetical protein
MSVLLQLISSTFISKYDYFVSLIGSNSNKPSNNNENFYESLDKLKIWMNEYVVFSRNLNKTEDHNSTLSGIDFSKSFPSFPLHSHISFFPPTCFSCYDDTSSKNLKGQILNSLSVPDFHSNIVLFLKNISILCFLSIVPSSISSQFFSVKQPTQCYDNEVFISISSSISSSLPSAVASILGNIIECGLTEEARVFKAASTDNSDTFDVEKFIFYLNILPYFYKYNFCSSFLLDDPSNSCFSIDNHDGEFFSIIKSVCLSFSMNSIFHNCLNYPSSVFGVNIQHDILNFLQGVSGVSRIFYLPDIEIIGKKIESSFFNPLNISFLPLSSIFPQKSLLSPLNSVPIPPPPKENDVYDNKKKNYLIDTKFFFFLFTHFFFYE